MSRIKPNYKDFINLNMIIKVQSQSEKIKKKGLKKRSNFSVKNKKCYACNKINHFIQNCRLKNFINKNKIFIGII